MLWEQEQSDSQSGLKVVGEEGPETLLALQDLDWFVKSSCSIERPPGQQVVLYRAVRVTARSGCLT